MSNLTGVLTGRINLKRNTQFVLDSISPSSPITVDRQPVSSSRLVVSVAGATVSNGLVNISGNVNETIQFDNNKNMVGSQNFTSISGITLSGINGGLIKISTVNTLGEPMMQERLIESNLPVRFYPINSSKLGMMRVKAGDERIAQYSMMVAPDKDVRENDIIYAVSGIMGLTIGIVSFVSGIFDFNGITHHIHCEVKNV